MDKNPKVLVIGAGLAGLVAAWAAREEGANVLVLTRGPIGRGSNSALANGIFAGPTASYSPKDYITDTLEIGRRLNNLTSVEAIAHEAREAVTFLRNLGIGLKEGREYYAFRSPDPAEIPGFALMKRVMEAVRGEDRVAFLPGFYVTRLLVEEGRIWGIQGFDARGKDQIIPAQAVILAAGGAGAVYHRHDNQKGMMGQGYALAAKAGIPLWDMEFVQFYPLVMDEPRLPSMLLYPPYPQEAACFNARGEDLLAKYGVTDLNEAAIKGRDTLSIQLFEEMVHGPVYVDFRKVPLSAWDSHPLSLLKKVRFDFARKPLRVSPAAHFFMGGVAVDERGQTPVLGLYACGEVVWGLHGANRRGGNALMECVVGGRKAGRNAATRALDQGELTGRFPFDAFPKGGSPPPRGWSLRELRDAIRRVAWEYAGVVRTGAGLKEGSQRLTSLAGTMERVLPQTIQERILKENLRSACLVLKGILWASLSREESRGSFFRKDFPGEDDTRWLKNSRLAYDERDSRFSLSHVPVEP
jgi:aspartate oxidase